MSNTPIVISDAYKYNEINKENATTLINIIRGRLYPGNNTNFLYFALGRHQRVGKNSAIKILIDDILDLIYQDLKLEDNSKLYNELSEYNNEITSYTHYRSNIILPDIYTFDPDIDSAVCISNKNNKLPTHETDTLYLPNVIDSIYRERTEFKSQFESNILVTGYCTLNNISRLYEYTMILNYKIDDIIIEETCVYTKINTLKLEKFWLKCSGKLESLINMIKIINICDAIYITFANDYKICITCNVLSSYEPINKCFPCTETQYKTLCTYITLYHNIDMCLTLHEYISKLLKIEFAFSE